MGIAAMAIATSFALSGCPAETSTASAGGGGSSPSCERPYLGDSAADLKLELVYFDADAMDHPLEEGGDVALLLPPQGGRVLFLGIRATNLNPCEIVLTGSMRDPDTQQVRFDTRTMNLVDDGDGWGRGATGDLASYANVPACHNTWTDRDVYGSSFELEVTVRDRDGKEATRTLDAIPRCAEPENEVECLCICKGGYVLGSPCEAAAGSGAGTGVGGGR